MFTRIRRAGRGKPQQRRFLITWDKQSNTFSVTQWNAWRRQPEHPGENFNAEAGKGVKEASDDDCRAMCEAWDQPHGYAELRSKIKTLDQLKRRASLGSAAVSATAAAIAPPSAPSPCHIAGATA